MVTRERYMCSSAVQNLLTSGSWSSWFAWHNHVRPTSGPQRGYINTQPRPGSFQNEAAGYQPTEHERKNQLLKYFLGRVHNSLQLENEHRAKRGASRLDNNARNSISVYMNELYHHCCIYNTFPCTEAKHYMYNHMDLLTKTSDIYSTVLTSLHKHLDKTMQK